MISETTDLAAPGLRVAFVDLLFSWPPNGGADADLYQVIEGLRRHGVDTHLFVLHETGSAERGRVTPAAVPFPITVIEASRDGFKPHLLAPRFCEAVDAWAPDLVLVSHGLALKPFILLALAKYRPIARYYAHELACARDALRFKNGRPCLNDFLRTPNVCRECAADSLGPQIRCGSLRAWAVEYTAAEAWRSDYPQRVLDSLAVCRAVIVSNTALQRHLNGFHDHVIVVPGGAPVSRLVPRLTESSGADKKVILMTGRVEDPPKGLDVLLRAGEQLMQKRRDFEIRATHFDVMQTRPGFRALGWLTYEETLAQYAKADIVAAPSVWEEPFGLVAVEAMACGLPVCASRVGGLADIVRHDETGFLFDPGDAAALAGYLDRLLEDGALRLAMGRAGRARAEAEYDWDVVIRRHYLPLLKRLQRSGGG